MKLYRQNDLEFLSVQAVVLLPCDSRPRVQPKGEGWLETANLGLC